MTMVLDRFYLVAGDAGWVERLVPLGIRLVQLRIKDASREEIVRQVACARKVCAVHGCQLVVNDHWQVALELGCDFVHLGQEDLAGADVASLRRARMRIGVSTHDHTELDRALAIDPDYVALGPVYPTLLKQMPWAAQGLERVAEWKRLVGDRPLVAIGGLTCDRLAGVFAAGADSAAVVTDIVAAADPHTRVRQWIAATRAP